MQRPPVVVFVHCRAVLSHGVPPKCPLCGDALSGRRLQDAPVQIQDPRSDGTRTSCCLLLHGNLDGTSDLHTGISDTEGVVYNYTRSGVQRDRSGWDHCVSVPLLRPDAFSLRSQWNQYLERFCRGSEWDPTWHRFDEDTHNCYSFCLSFINVLLRLQELPVLTSDQFTKRFILPRLRRVSRYLSVCRVLEDQSYYVLERKTGNEERREDRREDTREDKWENRREDRRDDRWEDTGKERL